MRAPAALAAFLGALLFPVGAAAYTGTTGTSTLTANPSSAQAGQRITITATFIGPNGQPQTGGLVTFFLVSGPPACSPIFLQTSATTDAAGVASIQIQLPAGCPGLFTIGARLGGVVLSVGVREVGGYPDTAALPDLSGAAARAWALGLLLLGLLALAYAGVKLARRPR